MEPHMDLYDDEGGAPWASLRAQEVYKEMHPYRGIKVTFRNGDKFALTKDHAMQLIHAMVEVLDDGVPDRVFEMYRDQVYGKLFHVEPS